MIVGLVYFVNSAAYQSTDDAFIDGHIVPVSAQVAGRVQSVYVDDNQSVNKTDLVVELDPRDFDAAVRQKAAALASSQAQAAAAQAALQVGDCSRQDRGSNCRVGPGNCRRGRRSE